MTTRTYGPRPALNKSAATTQTAIAPNLPKEPAHGAHAGHPAHQHRAGRRRIAALSGEFDAPCSVCGARPSVLLLEWSTQSLSTGASSGSLELQYFCRDHAAAALQAWTGG
jgi:hypothetical protein